MPSQQPEFASRVEIGGTPLGKGVEPGELIEAIRTVDRGDALLSPAATKAPIARFLTQHDRGGPEVPDRLAVLTDREREVLALVATGLSNDEIAHQLVVSPHTAKTHVKRAMVKLHAHDRAQLVVIAYKTGLVRPAPGDPHGGRLEPDHRRHHSIDADSLR
jgi:DNA-binding NarL/FixJ family response regulator